MMSNNQLIYFYDPMCSWCYGFTRVWEVAYAHFASQLPIRYVASVLAPDDQRPMSLSKQTYLKATWRRVQQESGAEFNFDFWTDNTPRRATYTACLTTVAARLAGGLDAERRMIAAIQQAYYRDARNPSDMTVLLAIATELGYDYDDINAAIHSATTRQALQKDVVFKRQMSVHHLPSVMLLSGNKRLNIHHDYSNANTLIKRVETYL